MSLNSTTLSSAVAVTDTSIVVASATGATPGAIVLIDQEQMQVGQSYTTGTTLPVLRGRGGTATAAHATSAKALIFLGSDETSQAPQTPVQWPVAGRARTITSYSAAGAITLPAPGADAVAILNGTTILEMTVAAPTKDMDGCLLFIAANGAAAHTITFANGLSGAGSSYNVLTSNATAPIASAYIAVFGLWIALVQVPMAGTVTNVTGTLD